MAKTKVQITIDEELLREVDDYCDKNYMNRSWLVSQSVTAMINQQKLIDSISNLSMAFRVAVENGNAVDDDTLRQVEQFQNLAKLFVK